MNVELRTQNEEVLGKGTLSSETIKAINGGDILQLASDCLNVKGTFVLVRKMFKHVWGPEYQPNVVLYVEET